MKALSLVCLFVLILIPFLCNIVRSIGKKCMWSREEPDQALCKGDVASLEGITLRCVYLSHCVTGNGLFSGAMLNKNN